ncbi:MAG: hypothetical protein DYG89_27305 [Caldilinea sp. CFX5]|nr:hypothetical protein [Caldilinea sp. CFX5]
MTVKFSRSVRSIQADSLAPVLVGIAFLTLLMVGWILWLFFAQVPTYATSNAAIYQPEDYITAEFSPDALAEIRRGQPAYFQPLTSNRAGRTIPLLVADVDDRTGQVRLILHIDPQGFTPLPAGTTGIVKVTVKQASPLLIVLRAAGLWPEA